MNFQDALEAARFAELPICRAGWNGKGMFVYHVPAASYPAQTGVAKRVFGENAKVKYGAYLALKSADGNVYPWTPSQADQLADDWEIVTL